MAPAQKSNESNSKGKVKRVKHDINVLTQAVEAIKRGTHSYRQASSDFGIPLGTLVDKVSGRRPLISDRNPKSLLTKDEEEKAAAWLFAPHQGGCARKVEDLREAVKWIRDERSGADKRKDNTPSLTWAYKFVKRHSDLPKKTPSSFVKQRAQVNKIRVREWYHELCQCCDAIDPTLLQSPERIFNANEIGFSFDPKRRKVIAAKGSKHTYKVKANLKKQVTVLACMSAAGFYLPPCLIYPYKRMPKVNLGEAFPRAQVQISDNGWITSPLFLKWLKESFMPAVAILPKPVLLLVDGHPSHTSLEAMELCLEHQVMLHCLLRHASHVMQPLDQAFFGSLKPAWAKANRRHLFETEEGVGLDSFAKVLRPVWESSATFEIAAASFRAAGIFPFDPEIALQSAKHGPSQKYLPAGAARDAVPASDCDDAPSQPLMTDDTPSQPLMTDLEGTTCVEINILRSTDFANDKLPMSQLPLAPGPSTLPDNTHNDVQSVEVPLPGSSANEPTASLNSSACASSHCQENPREFHMSEAVKALTADQISALTAFTNFIQEDLSLRKSKDCLSKLSSSEPVNTDDRDFLAFHEKVDRLAVAFRAPVTTWAALTEAGIPRTTDSSSKGKGHGKTKNKPTAPSLLSSEPSRATQKAKNAEVEEAAQRKKEKRMEMEMQKKKGDEQKAEREKKREEMEKLQKERVKRKRKKVKMSEEWITETEEEVLIDERCFVHF